MIGAVGFKANGVKSGYQPVQDIKSDETQIEMQTASESGTESCDDTESGSETQTESASESSAEVTCHQGTAFVSPGAGDRQLPGTTPEELKKLFGGVYDVHKSRSENIFAAIDGGYFPTSEVVNLDKIPFRVSIGIMRTLPKNVVVRGCTLVAGGLVHYAGDVTVTAVDANSFADGPQAKSFTIVKGGSAYANNQGSAYATNGGSAFALNDLTHAHADGKESRAYGMKEGSTVRVSNGATAYKSVEGVVIEGASVWRMTVLHENAPAYCSEKEDRQKFEKFKEYVLELNNLAWAEDAGAAVQLGTMSDDVLRECWGNNLEGYGNVQVLFLERAYQLKHPESAFKLGQYYEDNDTWLGNEAQLKKALRWYKIARDEMKHPAAQEKIDKINDKLNRLYKMDCSIM